MRNNNYQRKPAYKNTSGGKRAFVEDPNKAVFLSGFRTDIQPGQERQYREEVYQDINKKYGVYITKLDLPVNCKYGYLHMSERHHAAKLMNLKNLVRDEVEDRYVPEMILGGDSIKVYEYKKTQKRRDEESFVSAGNYHGNYPSHRETTRREHTRERESHHGYNLRDRDVSRDHRGYQSNDNSRSGTPRSYSHSRSRNDSLTRSNEGNNSRQHWRREKDFFQDFEDNTSNSSGHSHLNMRDMASAGINIHNSVDRDLSRDTLKSTKSGRNVSNYSASPLDSALVTHEVSEDERSTYNDTTDLTHSSDDSQKVYDWTQKQLSVIDSMTSTHFVNSGSSGSQNVSMGQSVINLPNTANAANIGHIGQDLLMCDQSQDIACQTSNPAYSPETAPILTQITVLDGNANITSVTELKTEKSNDTNASSDITISKQVSIPAETCENTHMDAGFMENVFPNDNCMQVFQDQECQAQNALVMNENPQAPQENNVSATYNTVATSVVTSQAIDQLLLHQNWPQEFNSWPNDDQVLLMTLFLQTHQTHGPDAALCIFSTILEKAREIEAAQNRLKSLLTVDTNSLVNVSMQTSLTN